MQSGLPSVTLFLLAFLGESLLVSHSFVFRQQQAQQIQLSAQPDSAATETKSSASINSEKEEEDEGTMKTWNPLRLAVLRLGFTEPAMTSPLNYGSYDGDFVCAYCGNTLFDSTSKYDSGSGWPSFWRTKAEESLTYKREFGGRLECKCKQCDSHLGHVFLDGPKPSSVDQTLLKESPESDPRGKYDTNLPRMCINGAALRYKKRSGQ